MAKQITINNIIRDRILTLATLQRMQPAEYRNGAGCKPLFSIFFLNAVEHI